MANPVTWFEISSRDFKRAKDFYVKVFGWSLSGSEEMPYLMIDTRTRTGIRGGVAAAGDESPFRGATFYVRVPDPTASLKTVKRLGGKTLMEPLSLPSGHTIALFADPEGNVVGLFKPERARKRRN